jgi:hypothetical protein
MLSPPNKVLVDYKTLVVKMVQNDTTIANEKINHELSCDVKKLLGLSCVLTLSKFSQGWNAFICDFIFYS